LQTFTQEFLMFVMFIPNFDRSMRHSWSLVLPENVDKIDTSADARLVAAARSR
jgi:hypothetical protein